MKKIALFIVPILFCSRQINATVVSITATSAGLSVADTRIKQGDTIVIRNINSGAKSSFSMMVTMPDSSSKTVTVASQGRDTTIASQYGVYSFSIGSKAYIITYPKTTHTVNYSNQSGFSTIQTSANLMDDFIITNNGSNQNIFSIILPSTPIGSLSQYDNAVALKLSLVGSYYITNGATAAQELQRTFISVVIPVNTTVSVSEQEYQQKRLDIYPNPAKNVVNIDGYAEVFSLAGKKVAEGYSVLDVSTLIQGTYIVKSSTGVTKLVKE